MKRKVVAVLAALTLATGTGVAVAVVIPPGTNGPGLAAVGPASANDGFPVWYQDKNGLRLENCVNLADPKCPAIGPRPDMTAPISFPANYPEEGFYTIAVADMPTPTGNARGAVQLEQAFANGGAAAGDQITFARTRYTMDVTPGASYTITSPVTPPGGKTLVATTGLLVDTEDIGVSPGDFSGALGARVGPFLTWDDFASVPAPAALAPNALGKATYVGDGVTPHKIVGSPYNNNFFRVEGPGINPSVTVDACPTVTGPISDCIETALFTLQGKLATTSGVTPQRATYTQTSATGGMVDVFALTAPGDQEAIQVSDVSAVPGFATTALLGSVNSAGHYAARVAYTGAQPPTTVQVSNMGDVPVTNRNITVVDRVSGTAVYTTGTPGTPGDPAAIPAIPAIAPTVGSLTVNAVSSDTVRAGAPALTASGFAVLPVALSLGSMSVPLDAPPESVTVASAAGGTVTLQVEMAGLPATPIPVMAMAGPDQSAFTGQVVTLDGSASTGALTYSWTSPAGITLTNPNSAAPTFTAPTVIAPDSGIYAFDLTVTGPGGPKTSTVTITVTAVTGAVANAGPSQTGVQRGTTVALDGRLSTSAATYLWTQVITPGDPIATLVGANTAQPTFTFPMYKFPAKTGALTFNLRVTSLDGSFSDAPVTVTPSSDTVAIIRGTYTASKRQWRIDGTSSSVLTGQIVTVHLGPLTGPVIGTAVVSPTHAWAVSVTSAVVGGVGQTVSVESQLGGTAAGFVFKVA